jgi:hypothetical protein
MLAVGGEVPRGLAPRAPSNRATEEWPLLPHNESLGTGAGGAWELRMGDDATLARMASEAQRVQYSSFLFQLHAMRAMRAELEAAPAPAALCPLAQRADAHGLEVCSAEGDSTQLAYQQHFWLLLHGRARECASRFLGDLDRVLAAPELLGCEPAPPDAALDLWYGVTRDALAQRATAPRATRGDDGALLHHARSHIERFGAALPGALLGGSPESARLRLQAALDTVDAAHALCRGTREDNDGFFQDVARWQQQADVSLRAVLENAALLEALAKDEPALADLAPLLRRYLDDAPRFGVQLLLHVARGAAPLRRAFGPAAHARLCRRVEAAQADPEAALGLDLVLDEAALRALASSGPGDGVARVALPAHAGAGFFGLVVRPEAALGAALPEARVARLARVVDLCVRQRVLPAGQVAPRLVTLALSAAEAALVCTVRALAMDAGAGGAPLLSDEGESDSEGEPEDGEALAPRAQPGCAPAAKPRMPSALRRFMNRPSILVFLQRDLVEGLCHVLQHLPDAAFQDSQNFGGRVYRARWWRVVDDLLTDAGGAPIACARAGEAGTLLARRIAKRVGAALARDHKAEQQRARHGGARALPADAVLGAYFQPTGTAETAKRELVLCKKALPWALEALRAQNATLEKYTWGAFQANVRSREYQEALSGALTALERARDDQFLALLRADPRARE